MARYTQKSYQKHKEARRREGLAYYYRNKSRANKKRAAYGKERYSSDPIYKLSILLRSRLNLALGRQSKKGSAVRLLGCSISYFVDYIASQFSAGMTWQNHGIGKGKWHLDHKRPLSKFNLGQPEQLAEACHFTNYQPLWSGDNIRKGAKLCWEQISVASATQCRNQKNTPCH